TRENGFANAQTKAIGQSRPPVAMPIQPNALIAEACGWPHLRASCPGSLPRVTTMITPTTISTAKTMNANASRMPNDKSIAYAFHCSSGAQAIESCELPGRIDQKQVARIMEIFPDELLCRELELELVVADRARRENHTLAGLERKPVPLAEGQVHVNRCRL